ncbi:MAG: GNAT family N-acetyltransferase [Treponemataceae bacterium]|nr:GNAT family N-acetyltransferase [Treponemataceae bacterium]
MDIIVLIGSGAVGKMTVGQELMKITDFRLFHNHMMIEPVIEIFGKFDGSVVSKLREDIFQAFLKTNYQGMIFTYMWAFDMQSDWDYIKSVTHMFEATGGEAYYVELVADQAVRLERNKTENRLRHKASKRDLEISQDRILREETKYRVVSREGELPFKNYMRIDNTNLEPELVAGMIKEHFKLPNVSSAAMMNRVMLEEVRQDELPQLYKMQVESFMPLYEKYHDDQTSPALESFERVQVRAAAPKRKYYFIVKDGARVGAINIGNKGSAGCADSLGGASAGKSSSGCADSLGGASGDRAPCASSAGDSSGDSSSLGDTSIFYISPVFVLPKYQNQGIATAAIKKAFELYPSPQVREWRLDTILEEKGNCHLYEKLGFVQVGEPKKINDRMTIVDYQLKL